MTECPCCFRETVDATGQCTRCGVQTSKGEPFDAGARPVRDRRRGRGPSTFDAPEGLFDKTRWKEDHQE